MIKRHDILARPIFIEKSPGEFLRGMRLFELDLVLRATQGQRENWEERVPYFRDQITVGELNKLVKTVIAEKEAEGK